MNITRLQRRFQYRQIPLDDPDPALDPMAVRRFYIAQFPELTNAKVEGPTFEGGADGFETYTFKPLAGTKG